MTADRTLVHATAVAVSGCAVLLLGPSGSGKSDLALRLMDRGWTLVADDQVRVERHGGVVQLSCPETIAGRIEVRGIGLIDVPHAPARLALAVELDAEEDRLPERRFRDVAGIAVPAVTIDPRFASAPLKVEWALRCLAGDEG